MSMFYWIALACFVEHVSSVSFEVNVENFLRESYFPRLQHYSCEGGDPFFSASREDFDRQLYLLKNGDRDVFHTVFSARQVGDEGESKSSVFDNCFRNVESFYLAILHWDIASGPPEDAVLKPFVSDNENIFEPPPCVHGCAELLVFIGSHVDKKILEAIGIHSDLLQRIFQTVSGIYGRWMEFDFGHEEYYMNERKSTVKKRNWHNLIIEYFYPNRFINVHDGDIESRWGSIYRYLEQHGLKMYGNGRRIGLVEGEFYRWDEESDLDGGNSQGGERKCYFRDASEQNDPVSDILSSDFDVLNKSEQVLDASRQVFDAMTNRDGSSSLKHDATPERVCNHIDRDAIHFNDTILPPVEPIGIREFLDGDLDGIGDRTNWNQGRSDAGDTPNRTEEVLGATDTRLFLRNYVDQHCNPLDGNGCWEKDFKDFPKIKIPAVHFQSTPTIFKSFHKVTPLTLSQTVADTGETARSGAKGTSISESALSNQILYRVSPFFSSVRESSLIGIGDSDDNDPLNFVTFGLHSPFHLSIAKTYELTSRFHLKRSTRWRMEGNVYICEVLGERSDGYAFGYDNHTDKTVSNRNSKAEHLPKDVSLVEDAFLSPRLRVYRDELRESSLLAGQTGGASLANKACFNNGSQLTPIQAVIHWYSRNYERKDLFCPLSATCADGRIQLSDLVAEIRSILNQADGANQVDGVFCIDNLFGCVLILMATGEDHKTKMHNGGYGSTFKKRRALPMFLTWSMSLLDFVIAEFAQEMLEWLPYLFQRPQTIISVVHEHHQPIFQYQTGVSPVFIPLLGISVFEAESDSSGNSLRYVAHPLEVLFPKGRPVYRPHLATSLTFPKEDSHFAKDSAFLAPFRSLVLRAPFWPRKEGYFMKALCEKLRPWIEFNWEMSGSQNWKSTNVSDSDSIIANFNQASTSSLKKVHHSGGGVDKEFGPKKGMKSFGGLIRGVDFVLFIPSEPSMIKIQDVYSTGVPMVIPEWRYMNKLMYMNAAQMRYVRRMEGLEKMHRLDWSSSVKLEKRNTFLNLISEVQTQTGEANPANVAGYAGAGKAIHWPLYFYNQLSSIERMPYFLQFNSVADILRLTVGCGNPVENENLQMMACGRENLQLISLKMRRYFFGRIVRNTLAGGRNVLLTLLDDKLDRGAREKSKDVEQDVKKSKEALNDTPKDLKPLRLFITSEIL